MTIHYHPEPHPDLSLPDTHQDTFSRTYLGFWTYLMTDCLLFATLFATYGLFHSQTAHGPSSAQIFRLDTAFIETMILLFSSVTCGLTVLSTLSSHKRKALSWLAVTFLLGGTFIFLEFTEFKELIDHGYTWQKSAFLSSFFTLVGTHGLHVTVGLLWMAVMMGQLFFKGITPTTFRRVVIFSLFWHFLDLIWIFIFTFVYLMGVL